ncbi:MAG: NUDIX domain-containing protein [Magnetococcales bacterium]|nr:NUDIX domain-containing protein [Magnetococcales bacterium]
MTIDTSNLSFKVLNLQGTPYEQGIQHGQYLKHEIHDAFDHCVKRWGMNRHRWDLDQLITFAHHCHQQAQPRFQEEIKGIADGSGINFDHLLSWNYLDDFWENIHCSAFAVHGPGTTRGRMIVGRNNDYEDDHSSPYSVTIIRQGDPNRKMTLCHTWSGQVGTYEGINEEGLVIGIQFIGTLIEEKNLQGQSIKQMGLDLLEKCASVSEVPSFIASSPRNFSGNLLAANRETAMVVEFTSHRHEVRHPENNTITATNHYCSLKPPAEPSIGSFQTELRYQVLQDRIKQHDGTIDPDVAWQILSSPPVQQMGPPRHAYFSLRSTLFFPDDVSTQVAHGVLPAARGPFLQISLPQMKGKRAGLSYIPFPPMTSDPFLSPPECIVDERDLHTIGDYCIKERTVALQDGHRLPRATVSSSDSVVIVPLTEDGQVRMIRQFRHSAQKWLLELPAGGIEAMELPFDAAKRELKEETGDVAPRWKKLGGFYSAPYVLTEYLHLYLAQGIIPGKQELQPGEHILTETFPWKDVIEKIRIGDIEDCKTIAAIMIAAQNIM